MKNILLIDFGASRIKSTCLNNYKINFDKISKSQKILLGDNSLAQKYIKYKPKSNIYDVVNELIKNNSKLLNHR